MSCARFRVSGKVQGVWFRAATREQALLLHLRGFARNLADGSVEVVATGDVTGLDHPAVRPICDAVSDCQRRRAS